MEKTNVMRLLDQKKVSYTPHSYPHGGGPVDGVTVARLLGLPPERIYKTLVTVGAKGGNYVFVIPVEAELDLKKAARAVGEKSIEMLHLSKLLPLTGYVRGGCSPVGMNKRFPTVIHEEARALETIVVSAGKIGFQVELSPLALAELTGGSFAGVAK